MIKYTIVFRKPWMSFSEDRIHITKLSSMYHRYTANYTVSCSRQLIQLRQKANLLQSKQQPRLDGGEPDSEKLMSF